MWSDDDVVGWIEVAGRTHDLLAPTDDEPDVTVVRHPSGEVVKFASVARALDAVLCDDATFSTSQVPMDEVLHWAARHRHRLPDPLLFECDDEAFAAIHIGDHTALVPACLEDGEQDGMDRLIRQGEVETLWSFSFSWDTGAVTTFGYSEDLYRYGTLYYLFQWKESDKEITRLGMFDNESDGRLEASKYSEVQHYREVAEAFPDEEYDE